MKEPEVTANRCFKSRLFVMLNINPGHNEKILEACKTLREYTEYTSRVREYTRTMDREAAVERAITECIQEGILEGFLKKNRAEAKSVSMTWRSICVWSGRMQEKTESRKGYPKSKQKSSRRCFP